MIVNANVAALGMMSALSVACGASHAVDDAGMDAAPITPIDGAVGDAGDDPACLPRTALEAFDAFIERSLRARCEHDLACGRGSVDWASVEECVRYDVLAHLFGLELYRGDVERGTLVLDPAFIDACLAEIRDCDAAPSRWARLDGLDLAWNEEGPESACWRALRLRCPAPGEGEPCAVYGVSQRGCGDGLFCDDFPVRCEGPRCRRRAPIGGACDGITEQCAASSEHAWVYCHDESPSVGDETLGECRGIEETPRAGDGGVCGRVIVDDVARLTRCAPGLFCARDGERWKCRGPKEDGEGCSGEIWEVPCRRGSFCDPATRTCAPRAGAHRTVAVGEPCEPGVDTCYAQYRTTCVDGVCVEAGRAAGQPCDDALWEPWGYRRCDHGSSCDMAPDLPRCALLRPDGARCDPEAYYWQCEGWCSEEGRCVPIEDRPWC